MRKRNVSGSRFVGMGLVAALFIPSSCGGDEGGTSAASSFTQPNTGGGAAVGSGAGTGGAAGTGAGSAADSAIGVSTADGGSSTAAPANPGFLVPADSHVCNTALPFAPPGCPCGTDAQACWTGPLDKRHVGKCRDGVQRCSSAGEFPSWGPCEGQVLDCGEEPPPPTPPPPPSDECPCVPGAVIGCDEDCAAGIICMPFSTKVCQPDGAFGPCRESLLPTDEVPLLGGCLNVFHGCFAENDEGLYVGDCSQAFACGQPPAAARVYTPH